MGARRDASGNYLTPEADEDHASLAMRAAESAIDLMVFAQDRAGMEAADHWQLAAERFDEGRRQCIHAAAALIRAYNAAQAAQGLVQCFACHAWRPEAEMQVTETHYQSAKDPDRRPSRYYRCKETCAE